MWVSRDMKFKLARLSSLELMVIGVDSPVSPTVSYKSPRVSDGGVSTGALSAGHVWRVKQQQLDALFNDALSSCSIAKRLHANFSSAGAARRADWPLHHQRCACVISKMKMEIYHWRWKMKQQEHSSDCFLSWPQLWAHTLLTCCHLSLSRAFASSPTVLARTGAAHATAKPSIRALQDPKQVCHWELLKFNRAGDVRRVGHTHMHTGNPVVMTNIGPFQLLLVQMQILSVRADRNW